jgi:murein DD-endopeptidase MepM/ murein hydrolase activator NlpD
MRHACTILLLEIGSRLKRSWIKSFILYLSLGFVLISPTNGGMASNLSQEGKTEGPEYVVQAGDSLWDIALRFRVTMDDLARVNGITDPNQLVVGAHLIIPGLEGIQGVLITRTIPYGETLRSYSRRYQVPEDVLVRLNHLTNPAELYVGSTLVIPEQNSGTSLAKRSMVAPGQSLLELAVSTGVNPWVYVEANELIGTWSAIPGDVLFTSGNEAEPLAEEGPGGLPPVITGVTISPSPLVQGKVAVIEIGGSSGLSLDGSLIDHEVHFFLESERDYAGMQGIHAMTEPGLYSLVISGTLPVDAPYFNAPFSFSQAVLVNSGNYPYDPVLVVSPETIDPAVTRPEDAQWSALASSITPKKLWNGIFQSPAPEPYQDCWPSLFGNRRSYNGSEYIYFHSGLDFCGGVGTEIHAPATGEVIFAGPLTVRGNATMIDHGWGIYTGYLHQSEILVHVGDLVQPGQVIGLVGGTGRVTGPHLHWEVWAGGVQVDPMDWLQQAFPH